MSEFRLPTNKQRTLVVGRTGSGKTVFGAWLLSRAPFHVQPYVIVDYKGDELLSSIEGARQISYKDKPKHPGIYYLNAMPGELDEMDAFLWGVWQRGKTGLLFDEGYMVPGNGPTTRSYHALNSILTQGRSKRIPVIMLSQRPTWLSRFAFSEADFFSVFHLNDRRDFQTVAAFTPRDDVWTSEKIQPYHSRWYDVNTDFSTILSPVQKGEAILETFHERLRDIKRKVLI